MSTEPKYTIEEIKKFIKKFDYEGHENPETLIIDIYTSLTPENIQKANSTHDKDQIKLL